MLKPVSTVRSSLISAVVLLLVGEMFTNPVAAAVAVVSNRTPSPITFSLLALGQTAERKTIASGDSEPIYFRQQIRIRYRDGFKQREYELAAANAYFFTYGLGEGGLHLERIGLGEEDSSAARASGGAFNEESATATIPVKIFVDDDEPTHRRIWEVRLRKRVAAASHILEKHSGVRLQVVSVDVWDSDDSQHDFNSSMREFEREVTPQPAQLAIGFSSQYKIANGRVHMGGTRGALYPYILLKERSPNVRETERLEMLVHELGHYLGASHSPEPQSVMRPVITGGQQRALDARIQFDPVNTLLVAMMGEEIRLRKVRNLTQVSVPTKKRMAQIYRVLNEALPDDPAASRYLQMMSRATSLPVLEDTRRVLNHLVKVAQERRSSTLQSGQDKGLATDALTNLYVKEAARTALRLPPQHAPQAMLLALGIFFDDTTTLRTFPATRAFVESVEPNLQRQERLKVLAAPTMLARTDLAKHFFVSAHLTAAIGSKAAKSVGLAKEMLDAQRGTGFSFADIAANQAGIIFAEKLIAGELSPSQLAQDFTTESYLLDVDDLQEGIAAAELKERFSGPAKDSLERELQRIERRILDLPSYNPSSSTVLSSAKESP